MPHPLIKLARQAIKHYLTTGKILDPDPDSTPSKYHQNQAAFVTLTQNHKLRGCIGSILSTEPLYKNIIKNAINAAVNDPRFPPLTLPELDQTKISISIIHPPIQFFFDSPQELINHLQKNKPGVILKIDNRQALFLPAVWEKIPNPANFLSALCQKALLPPNCWQNPNAQIFTFTTSEIKESN